MKTQKFNEQQLKDLVKGKEVVTCELVKKGEGYIEEIKERFEHPSMNFNIRDAKQPVSKGFFIMQVVKPNADNVFALYLVVQATNEKGEKQSFCEFCSELAPNSNLVGHGGAEEKPLLVRLEKIEVQKEKHTLDERGWKTKLPLWFKTWKRGN